MIRRRRSDCRLTQIQSCLTQTKRKRDLCNPLRWISRDGAGYGRRYLRRGYHRGHPNDMVRKLQSKLKGYQRQITHDGVYAVATLMAADDAQEEISPQDEDGPEDDRQKGAEEVAPQKPAQPRKCYIFCPEGDRARLFEELDHKTAAPLIPAFQDYVLTSLQTAEISDSWRSSRKRADRRMGADAETGG